MVFGDNDEECLKYRDSSEYKNGDKTSSLYQKCCENDHYCSFYTQEWFFWVLIASAVIFIGISILGCVLCYLCMKKRNGKRKPMATSAGNTKMARSSQSSGGGKKGKTTRK